MTADCMDPLRMRRVMTLRCIVFLHGKEKTEIRDYGGDGTQISYRFCAAVQK